MDLLKKRHVFTRSYVKLIAMFTNKHKALIPSKENELTSVLNAQLAHLESIVHTTEEFNVMLTTYLEVLNLQPIIVPATKCFEQWVSSKSGDSLVVKSILQTLSSTVTDHNAAVTVFEATLNSYFVNNGK